MRTASKENPVEKRIVQNYLELAHDMPIEKINVSILCRKCGIQRQTFYNHYSDIDSLIESIFDREGRKIFDRERASQSWQNGMYDILVSLKKNREFAIAVYQGVSREHLENRLNAQVHLLLKDIIDEMAQGKNLSEEDKNSIVVYHTYAFSGFILEWVRFGMKKDPRDIVYNIDMVIHGSIHEAIDRYAAKRKNNAENKMDRKQKVSI